LVKQRQSIYLVRQHEANLTEAMARLDALTDWGVVEVGLGGRLDSTNVVYGEIAVVRRP
jgi:folylpolyglutamate synthase/dihydropteroate synthase